MSNGEKLGLIGKHLKGAMQGPAVVDEEDVDFEAPIIKAVKHAFDYESTQEALRAQHPANQPGADDFSGQTSAANLPVEYTKSEKATGRPSVEPPFQIEYEDTTGGAVTPPVGAGGKGKSGFSAKITTSIGPEPDESLFVAQQAHMRNLALARILDTQARADAYGVVADIQGTLGDRLDETVIPLLDHIDSILDDADAEMDAIGDLIDNAKSSRVNPGQFFANVGGAGKWASALAVGVGAMATAFGGGPNAALGIINRAIGRNVRAQLANKQHDRALIAHQTNFVNTMRGLAQDRAAQAAYWTMAYTAMAKAEIERAQYAYLETNSRLAIRSVTDQLQLQLVNLEIQRITANRAKVEFTVNSALQYANVAKMLTSGQAAVPGAPPAAGAGGARAGAKGAPQAKALQSGDPAAVVKSFVAESKKQGYDLAQAKQAIDGAVRNAEGNKNLQDLLAAVSPHDIADRRKIQKVSISIAGKNADAHVVAPDRWNQFKGPQQADALADVQAAYTAFDNAKDIYNLLAVVNQSSRKEGIMRYLRTFGDKKLVGPARDADAVAALSELSLKVLQNEQLLQESKKGRNAISKTAEMVRIAIESGSDVGDLDQLADWLFKNKTIRQARYRPALDMFEERAHGVANRYGLQVPYTITEGKKK